MRPSLRDEDFNTEKQVIIEEIRMYEDQPPFGADDKCRAAFFGDHPLGRSVLGTVDSVGGLSVDAMRNYFGERYAPAQHRLGRSGPHRLFRLGRNRRQSLRQLGVIKNQPTTTQSRRAKSSR